MYLNYLFFLSKKEDDKDAANAAKRADKRC